MNEKNFDLDERLIEFASLIIKITETFPKTISGNYLSGNYLKVGPDRHYYMEKPMLLRADMTLFTK